MLQCATMPQQLSTTSTISITPSMLEKFTVATQALSDFARELQLQNSNANEYKKPKNVPPDQEWFWTEEWLAGESQADGEYARGEYKSFDTAEELIADLRSNL